MQKITPNKIFTKEAVSFMKNMPENVIDLTVTSPPYDDLRNYNGYNFPFEEMVRELFRVTKNGGGGSFGLLLTKLKKAIVL